MNNIAAACKKRAAENYAKFDMFVETMGDDEWDEWVEDMNETAAFAMMDTVSEVWADRRADAAHYAE